MVFDKNCRMMDDLEDELGKLLRASSRDPRAPPVPYGLEAIKVAEGVTATVVRTTAASV